MSAKSACSAPAAWRSARATARQTHDKSAPAMTRRETYLDWNATAPLRPEAVAAVAAALASCGNPSSGHRRGRTARQGGERARAAGATPGRAAPPAGIFGEGGNGADPPALNGAG